MTLGQLLSRTDLSEKGVLKKLICYYEQISQEVLRTNIDNELSEETIQKILSGYKSYVEDKQPLEYILGFVEFFGNKFFVDRATLIPRPETEYMITAVTEYINDQGLMNNKGGKKNTLLDIGTGCGVLGTSVLLQNPTYFSQAIFTDYFANALEVAKKNFAIYRAKIANDTLKVDFLQADLLDFLVDKSVFRFEGNVVLVANLPYIPERMFDENVADNVKNREPKPAFVGGEDGLDYYKIMFNQLLELQKSNFINKDTFVMFLEMMTWQVDILRQLYDNSFVFEEVKTFHFNIRIVKAYLK